MAVNLSPLAGAGAQFFTNNGVPLAGGLLYVYNAGTTTPLTTYTSSSGATANTNPIVLDSSGRVPEQIWLTNGIAAKFVLKTSADVQIWAKDNIPTSPQPPIVNDASSVTYDAGASVTAGAFIIGQTYLITSLGSTNFLTIGAASNTVGTYFIATGVGSGTGTADFIRSVQLRLKDSYSIKDFGAIGNGVADDTAAIQAAIDYGVANNVYKITVPTGTYNITAPIRLYDGICFIGDGSRKTIIRKSTNTLGTGSNTARSGTVTDSYAYDDILQLIHPDNEYCYSVQIKGMSLFKTAYTGATTSHAIYYPRAAYLKFEDLWTLNTTHSTYTNDCFVSSLKNIQAQGCVYGFTHANDGTGNGTGTSILFENCYVNFDVATGAQPSLGFNLFGLTYSNLFSCAVDNGNPTVGGITAYFLSSCNTITVSGCGTENSTGRVIYLSSGSATFIGLRTYLYNGSTVATSATVWVESAKLTLIECKFEPLVTAGVQFNLIVNDGADLVEINPELSPSGGNAFTGYTSGAAKTTITGKTITKTDSSGSTVAGYIPTTAGFNAAYTDASDNLTIAGGVKGNSFNTAATGGLTWVAATPYTLFTISTFGTWIVNAWIASSGANYQSCYLVVSDGISATITALKAGASLPITLSGLAVQVTSAANTTGGFYTSLKIG
jgi:hypothetical protein